MSAEVIKRAQKKNVTPAAKIFDKRGDLIENINKCGPIG
jgi:hypothetical protein